MKDKHRRLVLQKPRLCSQISGHKAGVRIKWLIASRVGRFLRFITLFNLDTVEFPPKSWLLPV